ncbi:MAG: alpha/beta hydrolase [Candidatus Dormibacteria bacterium]
MTAATLRTFSWRSAVLGRTKHLSVLLPPGHTPGAATKYPTLYLLHGYGGNRATWVSHTDLRRLVEPLGLIVVMPESGRRWLINDCRNNRYEDYLLDEVISFAEDTLGSRPQRGARAIAGFSMGGATAMMHALRHPDLFRVAASLGGAFEAATRRGDPYTHLRRDSEMLMPTEADHNRTWGPPGSRTRLEYDPFTLLRSRAQRPSAAPYLDVGTDDHPRILDGNRRLHQELVARDIDHVYKERPGGHAWDYIRAALPEMLLYVADSLHAPQPRERQRLRVVGSGMR